jgi:hypothetical protein
MVRFDIDGTPSRMPRNLPLVPYSLIKHAFNNWHLLFTFATAYQETKLYFAGVRVVDSLQGSSREIVQIVSWRLSLAEVCAHVPAKSVLR